MLGSVTEIAIPVWSLFAFSGSALLGLFTLVGNILLKQSYGKTTIGNIESTDFVLKEVCEKTQEAIHAEMRTIAQAVTHTNETLNRVEASQNEKLETLIELIRDRQRN
jgi:hypothetical protein